jgi:hypothetical protein
MKRLGILTAGSRLSARDLFGARLWLETQPQRLETLAVLRLVLRTQPRSADHASRITFHA